MGLEHNCGETATDALIDRNLGRDTPAFAGTRVPVRVLLEHLEAGDGEWRVAFAFDQDRKAILLIAGNRAGVNQKRFYKRLIAKEDERLDQHISNG